MGETAKNIFTALIIIAGLAAALANLWDEIKNG